MVLTYRTICPKNIAQFLIFYRTLSYGLRSSSVSQTVHPLTKKPVDSAFEIPDAQKDTNTNGRTEEYAALLKKYTTKPKQFQLLFKVDIFTFPVSSNSLVKVKAAFLSCGLSGYYAYSNWCVSYQRCVVSCL